MRYSGWRVFREALRGQKGWQPVWRDPEPRPHYDYVIIGGGGHGLATRLLPGEAVRPGQHRGAGEGLDRRRQHRTKHHHRPLELPARRQRALLRVLAQAVGGAGAGLQLQCHVLAAEHSQSLPRRRAARRLHPPRQRDDPQRRGCGVPRPRGRPGDVSFPQFRQCPLSDHRRPAAAARRHRPP